jgi:hypothetical protein
MLKDNLPTYCLPQSDDLSVEPNQEIVFILSFIDRNLSQFYPYYISIKDSDRENRISDFLIHYFQYCLRVDQTEGFCPFDFRKNPTQEESGKETDIGVFVLTKSCKPVTIIEFEAKRFSKTSKYKEYVSGERGGIERFKRGEHAPHLSICGMFGYVQSRTITEWIQKINSWIIELSVTKTPDIDWSSPEEQLTSIETFTDVEKLKSTHLRIQPQQYKSITLYHYFINLCQR